MYIVPSLCNDYFLKRLFFDIRHPLRQTFLRQSNSYILPALTLSNAQHVLFLGTIIVTINVYSRRLRHQQLPVINLYELVLIK